MSNDLIKRETALNEKGIQLQTMNELKEFAQVVIDSGLAPKALNKTESVIIAIQFGLEIGLSPLAALQSVAVINGMPSIYGDAAKALILSDPVCEYIKEWHTGTIKDGDLTFFCESKRKGEHNDPYPTEYSIEDAKLAGLWGKEGTWRKHPKRMLMFRARGFNLRDNFPDILKGFKTTEEVVDYEIIETKPAPKKGMRAMHGALGDDPPDDESVDFKEVKD